MKVIYCIHSVYNPGGMERVLLNKVEWFVKNHPTWEILVVTTDQHSRPSFYPFPEQVRMIDLGINYSEDNDKPFIFKTIQFLRKRHIHRGRLKNLLLKEKAEIVDSFYPGECSFVPGIKDGSRKVIELHQSKMFHHQYNRSGLRGLADRLRARFDDKMVRRFDKFVVLTQEDAKMWGDIPNMTVIPNAALKISDICSDVSKKRVIAVGRLDYQKSFDRLLDAWREVHQYAPDWTLDIFGQGEWKEMLQKMVELYGISGSAYIHEPTKQIGKEYINSSMIVMSSHYEGFPMVMIEAMACGLPAVSFDFKCGPRDIINDGENGIIVSDGDIKGLSSAILTLIKDEELRKKMSLSAKGIIERYSLDSVMNRWDCLYSDLIIKR